MLLPIHLLKGIQYLTPEELNRKLFDDKSKRQSFDFFNGNWSDHCRKGGLFFDLSQVRWVNIGAAVQLTLWIENARKENIQVYVALPLQKFTNEEERRVEDKDNSKEKKDTIIAIKNKRIRASSFLKIIQFDRAIRCDHIINKKEVLITEEFEFKKTKLDKQSFITAFQYIYSTDDVFFDYAQYNYKHIIPLSWINADGNFEDNLGEIEKHFVKILSNENKGMDILDVLSLKNVLLSEFLKNVKEHAGGDTKYGLLAIGLMAKNSLGTYEKNILDETEGKISYLDKIEGNYVKWLLESKFSNFIEIYFGDSGIGIVSNDFINAYLETNNLKKMKGIRDKKADLSVLKWSFDKWSTRKKEHRRGTKGIYRIQRIVNKYNGITLIKSKDLIGGYQKGGYSEAQWISNEKDNVVNFPGTFIQIKLCPYKDIIKFDFKFEVKQNPLKWNAISHELNKGNISEFREWIISNAEIRRSNTLLVLNFHDDIPFQTIRETLLDLKELSHIRHPNAIVVYLINDIGDESLEHIADSINEIIIREQNGVIKKESNDPDFEDMYDPVLLIGKNNNIFWFGEDSWVLSILNDIYKSESLSLNLKDIKSYTNLTVDKQIAAKLYFQNDPFLISIDENENIIFNFNNIQSIFPKQIKSNIISSNSYKAPICSPKLKVVDAWYDVNSLLKNDISQNNLPALFSFGLFLKFKENFPDYNVSKKTHILIDHNQQYTLALEFARLTGIDVYDIINIIDDVDYNIPRRTKLFDANDDVIIITTIISSTETIRRLVKFAKRDLGNPMIILSLVDQRDNNTPSIITWGSETKILSLYKNIEAHNQVQEHNNEKFDLRKYTKLLDQIKDCQTIISPIYQKEEDVEKKEEIELREKRLKKHLENSSALYYNHIGSVNGRHFTFYINKQNVLKKTQNDHNFIWDEFYEKIRSWIDSFPRQSEILDKLTLVIPEFNKENNNIWNSCVNYIRNNIKQKYNADLEVLYWNADKQTKIRNKDNIIYFDFGIMTGNTLNNFFECINYSENILIIVLFSQFQDNGRVFYEKIRALEYEKKQELIQNRQVSLFDEDNLQDFIKTEKVKAKIQIEFLYDLPIDFYNSSTCPICEHERALEYFKMEDEYMINFANDRKKRLRIKEKIALSETPCDFYYNGEDKNKNLATLSNELIIKMFDIKSKLKKALSSTKNRIELLNDLVIIVKQKDEEMKNPNSFLYAFLFFVSHEVLWFQKEPLVFREIRDLITEIALTVSTKDLNVIIYNFKNFTDEKQSLKIAVRYKYAAITVLRSSNKSLFCKNISNILFSSRNNINTLSNNLVQNTFYHIHSLQINNYNKSNQYYKDLDEQFKIISKNRILTNDQLITLKNLEIKNNTILKSLEISSDSILSIYKHYRNEFLELYNSKSHPPFFQAFQALDFRNYDGYEDYLEYNEDSEYYEHFIMKIKGLYDYWNFANNVIIPIIDNLPKNLFKSAYFENNSFFLENFVYKTKYSILKRFSETIYSLNNSTIVSKNIYENYNIMYDQIFNNLITYQKVENENSKNSFLMNFLTECPCLLRESILSIFDQDEFHEFELVIDDSYNTVFYPKTILRIFLKYIKENIVEKKNERYNKSLNDVSIKFFTTFENNNNLVVLNIINTKTGQYPKNKNLKGALFQFKTDLEFFGGSLNYETDTENDLFILTIKFIHYA